MNIWHALSQLGSRIASLLRRVRSHWVKQLRLLAQSRTDWRAWLNKDLSEVLAGVSRKLNESSHKDGFRIKNIEDWPLWFRCTVLSLLFAGVFAGIAYPIWSSVWNEYNHEDAESRIGMARYRHLAMESGRLEQNRERITVLAARFGETLEMIPAELEVVQVLNHFSQVARECGMQLEWFKPEAEVLEESYAILPINMRLSGSFPGAAKFLEAVSGMKHLVTVDMLLEAAGSVPGKVLLTARVKAYRGETPRSINESGKAASGIDATR